MVNCAICHQSKYANDDNNNHNNNNNNNNNDKNNNNNNNNDENKNNNNINNNNINNNDINNDNNDNNDTVVELKDDSVDITKPSALKKMKFEIFDVLQLNMLGIDCKVNMCGFLERCNLTKNEKNYYFVIGDQTGLVSGFVPCGTGIILQQKIGCFMTLKILF